MKLFGRNGKVLRNVYVPKNNGETSEIDVLFITQKGIFVIESKNYSGWIFGAEKDAYWTAMLQNKSKNRFYNPIKQNQTHIKWLGKYLGDDDIPLFSLIVFSERCELKKVTVDSPEIRVIKRDKIYANVRDIWERVEDKLSEDEISLIFDKLKNLTNVGEAEKQAHIDSINKRYKKDKLLKAEIKETEEPAKEEKMICPKCGGDLILRVVKKGNNAGNSFYGCSNFPKCRYIKNEK